MGLAVELVMTPHEAARLEQCGVRLGGDRIYLRPATSTLLLNGLAAPLLVVYSWLWFSSGNPLVQLGSILPMAIGLYSGASVRRSVSVGVDGEVAVRNTFSSARLKASEIVDVNLVTIDDTFHVDRVLGRRWEGVSDGIHVCSGSRMDESFNVRRSLHHGSRRQMNDLSPVYE